jgi:hypothetical protein
MRDADAMRDAGCGVQGGMHGMRDAGCGIRDDGPDTAYLESRNAHRETRIVIALARCLVHYEQVSADGFKIGEDTLIAEVPLSAGVDVWAKMREGVAALEERIGEMRRDGQ